MKIILSFTIILVMIVGTSQSAWAHCQIPCGIYDDEMRFKMIEEDIATVEKSMLEITKLSQAEVKDYNQIVRWVDNKEHHADKISDTVTYYFMAQRVKPAAGRDAKYEREIALMHELVYYSMKAKQTTDTAYVDNMRKSLAEFKALYNS